MQGKENWKGNYKELTAFNYGRLQKEGPVGGIELTPAFLGRGVNVPLGIITTAQPPRTERS